MEVWVHILGPFMVVLARVSGFFAVLPVFSWHSLPIRIRAGVTLVVSIFFAAVTPPCRPAGGSWLACGLLIGRELLVGLALGLAVRMVFMTLQQAGRMLEREMGLAMAEIIDPTTEEQAEPLGLFFEMAFVIFFLAVGGHQLLLVVIARSYQAFPAGQGPDALAMAEGVVNAGSAMLLFSLQLAGPVMAAFLVLSVVLGVLARMLPEMNILMESLPLRVGLGLFMASAMVPHLATVTSQLADWINRLLVA